MKALVSQNHQTIIRDITTPSLQDEDVLLQVKACGVCFSDIHKIRYQPLAEPVVLGHEVAGNVVEVGGKVVKFKVGDRVAVAHHVPCMECHSCQHGNVSMCTEFKESHLDPGGFAEFVRIPGGHLEKVAFLIPEMLSNSEASFMEPLGCCVRAVKRSGIRRGDVVVLVGLGSIGLLLMQLICHAGAECIGLELDPNRRAVAEDIGRVKTFVGVEPEFRQYLAKVSEGRGADNLLLTAGSPALIANALSWLRAGGTCTIFASLHPEAIVPLDWNELYYREINIVSSYSSSPVDLAEALEFLERGVVKVSKLANQTFTLEQFDEALASVESRAILKAVITPHAS
ncbi:MAG: alcohol dehydrogenase catalytic domain-containing protein [Verrucomicrobiota bacterium]